MLFLLCHGVLALDKCKTHADCDLVDPKLNYINLCVEWDDQNNYCGLKSCKIDADCNGKLIKPDCESGDCAYCG